MIKIKKEILIFIFFIGIVGLFSCMKYEETYLFSEINYKQKMRDFVQGISSYSKGIKSDFIIITQNGSKLVTSISDNQDTLQATYIRAIDGIGQEDLNYGYNSDNKKTPNKENQLMRSFLDLAKNYGKKIMVTDYCSRRSKMKKSYSLNNSLDYISFAADHRDLDNIPNYPTPIYAENSDIITSLKQAKNFLYLINPSSLFKNKDSFVQAIKNTNYDYVIIDFFHNEEEFTVEQIKALREKKNGGRRLLICYMSIGEAEQYRYYWQSDWKIGSPSFIQKENPKWKQNYIVRYWEPEWQNIIFGNDRSYVKKILDKGFDGVYLDIIDAFEEFEN